MSDVERSFKDPLKMLDKVAPGTIALIAAAFVAFAIASATMFDSVTDEPLTIAVAAEQRDPRLDQILAQQAGTREDLVLLRQAVLARAARAPEARPAAPAQKAAPPPRPERDFDAVLARIDRYLGSLQNNANTLLGESCFANAAPTVDCGTHAERLVQTVREARDYVRSQRRTLSGAAAPPETAVVLALAATTNAAAEANVQARELARLKLYIIAGMFAVLGLAFIAAVVAIFTASSATTVAFAMDTVKTMLGFFIGVITAFMGAPA